MPAAFAQEPPAGGRDDVNGTMRIIVDPDATEPVDIVRKIPSSKGKRSNKSADSPAKDLASPGKSESDDGSGSPAPEPGTPEVPDTQTDPGTPAGPGTPAAPDVPGPGGNGGGHGPDVTRPDPGELGHEVSDEARHRGEEARRHHDPPHDKPRGPDQKPPRHPDHPSRPPRPDHPTRPPRPDHPQVKPPRGPRGPGPG